MKSRNKRHLIFLIILLGFLPMLKAEDRRVIPLDMFLIIDGSEALKNSKNAIIAWINEEVIDRLLMDADKITILSAGDKSEVIYSGTVSGTAGKEGIKDKLRTLGTGGKAPDFSGALRDVISGNSQVSQARLSYTMLISASAAGLVPALAGGAQSPLRWFRSERHGQWQVLIVGPDIGSKVRQAAAAYMSR